MNKNEKLVRLEYIDVAKGLGILLVIMQHLLGADVFGKFILSFHMPFFFLISGYLYVSKTTDVYFSGKIKTLLIPLITYKIINMFIYIILLGVKLEKYYSVLSLGGMWFIESLLYVVCIFFVVDTCLLKFKNKIVKNILFFIIAIIGGALGILYLIENHEQEFPFISALIGNLFFTMGYFMKKLNCFLNKKNIMQKRMRGCLGILFLIIAFILSGYNTPIYMYVNNYGNIGIFIITAVLGSIGLLLISIYINKNIILEFYGKNSLIVLVTHFPLFKIVPFFLRKIISQQYICILVSFIIICLLEIVIINIINKRLIFLKGVYNYK